MSTKPDEKINTGICVVCAVLGGWAQVFLQAVGVVRSGALWGLAGMAIGLLLGAAICATRPRFGQEGSIWRRVEHFFLTQMNMESAFKRRKK